MITKNDCGKIVVLPIDRDTMTYKMAGRPMEIHYLSSWGEAICLDEENQEVNAGANCKVLDPIVNGIPYKVFVYSNPSFTMTLPRGSLATRVKELRKLFHVNSRVELVKGSTRNKIRIRFTSARTAKDYPDWELVALNIGEGTSGTVHEEKRRVRGAYPGPSQGATKAGRRDRAPRRR